MIGHKEPSNLAAQETPQFLAKSLFDGLSGHTLEYMMYQATQKAICMFVCEPNLVF